MKKYVKILSNSKIFTKFLAKDEDAHEHPVEIPESATNKRIGKFKTAAG